MEIDSLADQILEFVYKQSLIPRNKIVCMDLVGSDPEALFGDDVWELVERFSAQFGVKIRDFRWYHHTGAEGFNPFWIFFKPRWCGPASAHVPIYFNDLVESARCGEWTIKYPEDKRHAIFGSAMIMP